MMRSVIPTDRTSWLAMNSMICRLIDGSRRTSASSANHLSKKATSPPSCGMMPTATFEANLSSGP